MLLLHVSYCALQRTSTHPQPLTSLPKKVCRRSLTSPNASNVALPAKSTDPQPTTSAHLAAEDAASMTTPTTCSYCTPHKTSQNNPHKTAQNNIPLTLLPKKVCRSPLTSHRALIRSPGKSIITATCCCYTRHKQVVPSLPKKVCRSPCTSPCLISLRLLPNAAAAPPTKPQTSTCTHLATKEGLQQRLDQT
jgi:hypothetical protein